MTITVQMLTTVMGESGTLLSSGSSYAVSDKFAAELVGSGRAIDTYFALKPVSSQNRAICLLDASGVTIALLNSNGLQIPVPIVLKQSAIPVILVPNGTVAADGTITLGTALPTIYANAWVRLPAGAVVGGAAGLYYATFSSTTVGSIKTNFVDAATAFTPYIPSGTLTAAVGSGSAYTQTTAADVTLANITVPGGLMGANGALRNKNTFSCSNTAGNKTTKNVFASTAFSTQVVTTSTAFIQNTRVMNAGSLSSQLRVAGGTGGISWSDGSGGGSTVNNDRPSINTSTDQPLTFTGQIAVATDYIVLEGFTVEVLPS